MGNRKYPYFDRALVINRKGDNPKRFKKIQCCACAEQATHFVHIHFNWFRGDDERYSACPRHKEMAETMLTKFLAHVETKQKFLAEQKGDSENVKV